MGFLLSLVLGLVMLVAVLWILLVVILSSRYPVERWSWKDIDLKTLSFPKDFVWGVAAAAHQVDGNTTNNNWSDWEQQNGPDGQPRIKRGQKAGLACDHWNRYREDLGLMKQLGMQAYRLSVEWSRIEPRPGEYDAAAIQHYHDVLDAMKQEGLQAMVTLHHFTHPLWFHELGAFEKEENIAHFVKFSERVFSEYQSKVNWWCTINEPSVFTTMGYMTGTFPPGKQDANLMALVQRNVVLAHARVYHALKQLPGGDTARIGCVNNLMQFDPNRRWHLADWLVARAGDMSYNQATLHHQATGIYRLNIPGMANYSAHDPEVKGAGDFVGLNYYSHNVVEVGPSPTEPMKFVIAEGETPTDMPYSIYAEGFYLALKQLSKLGKPIYVTENGIADAKDDRRELFIRRYLYALSKAIKDGLDVRGYFYWSLMDNFEWAEGFDMKFGLYAMDPDTRVRTLRNGSKAFQEIAHQARGMALPSSEPHKETQSVG